MITVIQSPANAGFISLCPLYINTMPYTIQYWNESAAEWRGTGAGSISDRETARQRMCGMAEMTDYMVRFRIEPQPVSSGTVEWL